MNICDINPVLEKKKGTYKTFETYPREELNNSIIEYGESNKGCGSLIWYYLSAAEIRAPHPLQ